MIKTTIFVAGIHGVGKTHFCDLIDNKKFKHITASSLIKNKMNSLIKEGEKKVADVKNNQLLMIDSFNELRQKDNSIFLFDGHFILLNKNLKFEKIDLDIFKILNLSLIILFIDNSTSIFKRLKKRDSNTQLNLKILEEMQKLEVEYAKDVSRELKIPLEIINLSNYEAEPKFLEILSKYI